MKKMLSLLTAAMMIIGMNATAFAADINVTVDGTPVVWTDAKPFIDENDRTLVPLRPIANALGLEVTWNDDTNTASFNDGRQTAHFTVGSDTYHCYLNDIDFHVAVQMDTKPVIADSRIYAPARYLAECFQYEVGWNQAAQTVTLVNAAPEEETVVLPQVPEGQMAAMFPVTAEAGTNGLTYITFDGVTFAEDPDTFEYYIDVAETNVNGIGFDYSINAEENYVEMHLGADIEQAPGKYNVTLSIPKEYFADAKENILVSTTLTVTAPKAETALKMVLDDLDWGVETTYGANAAEITEAIYESMNWTEYTIFLVTVAEGDWAYDSEGNIIRELWECTVTVTNTETGESASESNVLIPLTFDPESAW